MLPKNTLGRQMLSQAEGLRAAPSTRTLPSSRCRSRSPRSRSSRHHLRQKRLRKRGRDRRRIDRRRCSTEYTTESDSRRRRRAAARPCVTGARRRAGRRKKAIARVRIVPGTGKWKINGRTLEDYFPNKVHQQEVNEPFKVLELDGRYDVIARISGGGVSGQAGALRLGVARALNGRRGQQPPAAEEGRLPDP